MRRWLGVAFLFLVAPLVLFRPMGLIAEERAQALPTAEEVIDHYTDALGGRETLTRVTTRVCIGRLIHDLSWKTPSHEVVPVVMYGRDPDGLLVVEHKSEGVHCEGFNGEVTWAQDPTGVKLKESPVWRKTAWLADPQGALRLEVYFPGLEVKSTGDVEGRAVYVVEPADLAVAHYALHFDVETGLLIRIGYYWDLEDYRDVGGVKFPFRIAMSRKGGSSTYVFDLVEHNLPLDGSLFAVPTLSNVSDE